MNRMIRFIAALAALMVSACGPSAEKTGKTDEPPAKTGSDRVVGLSVLTLTNPFFKDIAEAMKTEGEKHGYSILVVSGDFDVAKQQNQVKDFIVKKVSAIVLTPCDSKAIGPSIREANEAGIPVFTADIACLDPEAQVVTHVATDNLEGGRQAARAMIEALDGHGRVAILDHPMIESVMLRTQGFREVIESENQKGSAQIDIVATLPGGGDKEPSFKATEDLIQANPQLDGIFAINDPSALGAIAALEKAGRLDQVTIVAFDGMPEGRQAIKDGKIYADPIQFPDRIGTETMRAIVRHFEGETLEKEHLIPTALYTKAQAEADPTLN